MRERKKQRNILQPYWNFVTQKDTCPGRLSAAISSMFVRALANAPSQPPDVFCTYPPHPALSSPQQLVESQRALAVAEQRANEAQTARLDAEAAALGAAAGARDEHAKAVAALDAQVCVCVQHSRTLCCAFSPALAGRKPKTLDFRIECRPT
jgi:hypothetical protein